MSNCPTLSRIYWTPRTNLVNFLVLWGKKMVFGVLARSCVLFLSDRLVIVRVRIWAISRRGGLFASYHGLMSWQGKLLLRLGEHQETTTDGAEEKRDLEIGTRIYFSLLRIPFCFSFDSNSSDGIIFSLRTNKFDS
ncbi:hypothetical protein L873DRAFT_124592 [Choiromyces venosus 120613-1]|uniref:Uncharacterized protein n=1 Tax=Choiromyces venosus 120613-1 TaxID=1336337 RepID=A0A3N4J431_9PEZI|nr:hypothetical protein L873DRAFT_124592 [Choiromyces venosus 120613-1]